MLQKHREQQTFTGMFQAEKEARQMALLHGDKTPAVVKETEAMRKEETKQSGKRKLFLLGSHVLEFKKHEKK